MTWIDRLLVRLARLTLTLLDYRFSEERQRVWWWNVSTIKPVPGYWPDRQPHACGMIGFGSTKDDADNVFTIEFTEGMAKVLHDGTVESWRKQAAQVAILRQEGQIPPEAKGPLGV